MHNQQGFLQDISDRWNIQQLSHWLSCALQTHAYLWWSSSPLFWGRNGTIGSNDDIYENYEYSDELALFYLKWCVSKTRRGRCWNFALRMLVKCQTLTPSQITPHLPLSAFANDSDEKRLTITRIVIVGPSSHRQSHSCPHSVKRCIQKEWPRSSQLA